MPKTARQIIIKENDDLFRKIINIRDVICQKTGRTDRLQVAHYWSRGRLRVRWDLDNAALLGAGIHHFWAHVHPQDFREWFIKRLGQQRFDELEIRARYAAPVSMEYLQMMNTWLELKLEEPI